jgi:tripartite-type tricarboxylate transporter receptor subunit TctC
MDMISRRGFAVGLAALSAVPAQAQDSRVIKLVVPYAAGGSTDVMARIVAEFTGQNLGRTILIENKAGAGTVIGNQAVAAAAPDGATFLFATSAYSIAQVLYERLPYDPDKDLEPISHVASVPLVVMVHPKLPVTTLTELIAYLRQNPGKVSYGSAGTGSALHMAVELFRYLAKVEVVHIPYRGAAPALVDALAGNFELFIDGITTAAEQVKQGKLRALAVASPQRSFVLPDVPTAQEAGLPGFETYLWNIIMAPRGTPQSIKDTLRNAIERALADPRVETRFREIGAEIVRGSTPEQVRALMDTEIAKWRPFAAANEIRLR